MSAHRDENERAVLEGHKHAKAAQLLLFPKRKGEYYSFPAPTLPEICLLVRASINGSADPWPAEELREVREMLAARLAFWLPESPDVYQKALDAAVHVMCQVVIEMIGAELQQRYDQVTQG